MIEGIFWNLTTKVKGSGQECPLHTGPLYTTL
jgi:hypothetical protein